MLHEPYLGCCCGTLHLGIKAEICPGGTGCERGISDHSDPAQSKALNTERTCVEYLRGYIDSMEAERVGVEFGDVHVTRFEAASVLAS